MGGHVEVRLFGFTITVQPIFLVVAVVLGLGSGGGAPALIAWVIVVIVSVTAHELGHALTMRHFGQDSRITLHAFGGVTTPIPPYRMDSRHQVPVSLAGPLPGIVVGGLVLAVVGTSRPSTLAGWAVSDFAFVNLGWGVLNLMPVLPLDGGQTMAGILARLRWSPIVAWAISAVVGVALAILGLVKGQLWLGGLFGFLAFGNIAALAKQRQAPPTANPPELLAEGYAALEKGAHLAVANRANEVLATAKTASLRDGAVSLLMWSHLLSGDPAAAAAVVAKDPPWDPLAPVLHPKVVRLAGGAEAAVALLRKAHDARPSDATRTQLARGLVELGQLDDALLLVDGGRAPMLDTRAVAVVGAGLFRAGRFADAAQLGEASFARSIDRTMAYNTACAWSRADRPDDALAWLHRAVDIGYRNLEELEKDPNLAAARGAPGFDELRARMVEAAGQPEGA